jgi:proteasome alpha subunit
MSMQFYVSPEQAMKDRADYARKGIARGRSLVGMEYADGVVVVAENPSASLNKVAEIYDRIAFAGVGRYNEFETLKIAGIRHADVTGYAYSRDDVTARSLANAYAQTLGQIFTHEMKPYEVEILVASVGSTAAEANQLYHVLYDGTVMDEHGFTVLGGSAEAISDAMEGRYTEGLALPDAVRLGTEVLGKPDERTLETTQLEVAVLDRTLGRRTFRRIPKPQVAEYLSAS